MNYRSQQRRWPRVSLSLIKTDKRQIYATRTHHLRIAEFRTPFFLIELDLLLAGAVDTKNSFLKLTKSDIVWSFWGCRHELAFDRLKGHVPAIEVNKLPN